MNNQLEIYSIILQCTFCIMGQQPNYSSELNLIKVGEVIA
jgi:hypothetical protein